MSYPIQSYKPNKDLAADQQYDRTPFDSRDIVQSFLGLANRMMGEMLERTPFNDDMLNENDPNVKVFGISSMNVTQISRGRDGRPHIVQAHDERRMGPGGVWQTKKALRDPERGIDKMQVGYFIGDQGEIIERHLDPTSGQYQQTIKRRGIPSNDLDFSNQWKTQAQQTMQRPQQQQQQQLPYNYDQYPPLSYDQYSQVPPPPPLSYEQQSRVPSPPPPFYEPYPSNSSSYQYY